MDALDELQRGRESYGRRAWRDAYAALSSADQATGLDGADLERLAVSAYLIGREGDFLTALERAHQSYIEAGNSERAAHCAFWLGLCLFLRGEPAQATGWLARAQRLLERAAPGCAVHGYLMLPAAEQQLRADDSEAAYATAAAAAAIGDRCGEADLVAAARHVQGRALISQGQVAPGLALLDEAMVAVTTGELSPIMTGLVYCSVIDCCQQVCATDHAREWTSALARWCEEQPTMVAFTGRCMVHRAEILQLHGAWQDALGEAQRAGVRFAQGIEPRPPAAAYYCQGEVHRLRGEFAAAERAYRSASQGGREPQPGLALLRLRQGRNDAAAAAIRRVVNATTDRLQRARLLPAQVEILLAEGDMEDAIRGSRELAEIAACFETSVLGAMAAHARGAVELAQGDAHAALALLRHAHELWQQVEAPYELARTRELIGLACRALGDDDSAGLELDAARVAYQRLGAAPDLARIDKLGRRSTPVHAGGLTVRELQVLRLVAAGKTNKAIATELFVSVKTVDRHLSNIFTKLDVPSRAAATAYAYEHQLI